MKDIHQSKRHTECELSQSRGVTISIDGYTRFCLTAITVLLTVMVIGLWANDPASTVSDAAAAARKPVVLPSDQTILPNAGSQRLAILRATRATNEKLDKIVDLLKSGEIRVVLVESKPGKATNHVKKRTKK